MTSAERYRPIVQMAIREISTEVEWFTAAEVFEHIHGFRPWRRQGRKHPSPGPELVVKIINELRREGFLEYNPDSLSKASQWRLS